MPVPSTPASPWRWGSGTRRTAAGRAATGKAFTATRSTGGFSPAAARPAGRAREVLAGQAARSRPVRHRLRRVPGWPHLPADIPHLEARRAAPVADAGTIVSLCKALLGAAGGSLTPRTMAAAIGMRLGIGQAPVSLDAASLDPGRPEGYPARDSTADAALRESRAVEILALLNDRERVALAWPECTVRELAPVLGVGPSQAHIVRRRAIEMLREERRGISHDGWREAKLGTCCASPLGRYSPRSELSLARRSSSSASSVRRRLISRLTRVSSALACSSLT